MGWIYKYVYQGNIVYIGKSDSSLEARINAHTKEEKFQKYLDSEIWYFETVNNVETAVAEKILIDKYKPLLNVVDKQDGYSRIDFKEPEWRKHDKINVKYKEYTNKVTQPITKPSKNYIHKLSCGYRLPVYLPNSLSQYEGRLLRYILSLYDIKEKQWIDFNIARYFWDMGFSNGGREYQKFYEAIHKLASYNLIEIAPYSNAIKLKDSIELKNTIYEIAFLFLYKSKYSIQLFEGLKEQEIFRKTVIYLFEDLKKILGAERYKQFKDFHTRVLKPAVKEINDYMNGINSICKTNALINYTFVKDGKTVTHIVFERMNNNGMA